MIFDALEKLTIKSQVFWSFIIVLALSVLNTYVLFVQNDVILTHWIFQFYKSFYFEISEQNIKFTFLLLYYLNSTLCEKLVLLPNCVNAWKYH